MKKLQLFTTTGTKQSIAPFLNKIRDLPLPYTGNKKKLLKKLCSAIENTNLEFDTVLDAFTGSATVALMFKAMGKRVLANDLLTSSYLNAVTFVENNNIELTDKDKRFLLYNVDDDRNRFVEDNYLCVSDRQPGKDARYSKFTLSECRHLDNFRNNIDKLCGIEQQSLGMIANAAVVMRLPFGNVDQSIDVLKHRKKQTEHYGEKSGQHDRRIGIYYDDDYNLKFEKWFMKYVKDFTIGKKTQPVIDEKIKRASFLTNIQQHVLRDCMVQGRFHNGQALAEYEVRTDHQKNQLKAHWSNGNITEMDFFSQTGDSRMNNRPGMGLKWWTFIKAELPGSGLAVNMDVTELLRSDYGKVDCVYFDPPYGGGSSNYAEIYRFLEEYVYSKPLEELDHIQKFGSKFVSKRGYEANFVEMLEAAVGVPIWMFSYNDSSWNTIENIVELIRRFKQNVSVIVLSEDYRYLYRKSQGRTDKSCEYLIVAK